MHVRIISNVSILVFRAFDGTNTERVHPEPPGCSTVFRRSCVATAGLGMTLRSISAETVEFNPP